MLYRFRDRAAIVLVLLSVVASACSPGPPAPSSPPAASLQSAIASYFKHIANDDGFSGAVLVAKDFVPFASAVNGLADRQRSWYISTQTNLNVGSIAKLFTAVAIGELVDAGKIALGDPLSKYLPSYPKLMGDRITIAMLLAHTAGTGDYLTDPGYARANESFGSLDDLIAAVDTSVPAGTLLRAETLRALVLQPLSAGRSPLPITASTWTAAAAGMSVVLAMTETGYTVVVLANVSEVAQPIADHLLTLLRGA